VGKSTLFNRLVGRRLAIVQNDPGVTRDRLYGQGDWDGKEFVVVDTGGLTPTAPSVLSRSIEAQARVAIDEADVILHVVDVRDGLTPEDREVATLLRQSGKPVLLAANKADGARGELEAAEFYELGFSTVYPVSAQHGRNLADLLDALVAALSDLALEEGALEEDAEDAAIRVALVGRPNAGKSSLVNRLIGEDRMLVDAQPGTTRDPVDSLWEVADQRFRLIDTAGIRRKRAAALDMEKIAVVKAVRAVERAQVACQVIDAEAGATEQDARIASLCNQGGRALVLVVNKIDRVPVKSPAWREMERALWERLRFVTYAPLVAVSATEGQGISKLPGVIVRVFSEWNRRITTSVLNRFLADAVADHHPAAFRGKEVKLYYVTQASVRPPTFVFSTSHPDGVKENYRRYLANRLRETFQFEGTPLRLFFRGRGRKE
jgi:GTP-binding protein